MKKYICIHGHFYQPPRENPWTGEVDHEPSAAPYHDWNERIAKECYAANARAPILNEKGEVAFRLNNYSKISFDVGPTLLSWLKRKEPETYKAIVDADRASVSRNHGHGNAMAQAYNHLIMPLASRRDKITQIIWGARDFEFHFGRKPEGMWLPEAAVDRQTLGLLADQGIRFTILAPHQAKRTRRVGFDGAWETLHHDGVNTRHPYRVTLDGGKMFHVFFYDGPLSRAIAFQGLLNNGDVFAHKLLSTFGHGHAEQLVSTSTDGESFGHHHKLGEMALAYTIKKLETEKTAHLTNYAAYLSLFGSLWEVDLFENSSWSCPHGVERWRSDCGCRIQYRAGTTQRWRAVLREAMDTLKAEIDRVFENEGVRLLKDPWAARNDYIQIMLDPSNGSRKNFLDRHAKKNLAAGFEKEIWDLLEAQKFSLFMYTSCGWFFDDISGLEPVQVMKFALRAMEIIGPYLEKKAESEFKRILARAQSNFPEKGTGADIFERDVRPIPLKSPLKVSHGV